MKLGQSGGENSDRVEEAKRILSQQGLMNHVEEMSPKEATFVEQMGELGQYGDEPTVSPHQLFWLRDLCEKYCR